MRQVSRSKIIPSNLSQIQALSSKFLKNLFKKLKIPHPFKKNHVRENFLKLVMTYNQKLRNIATKKTLINPSKIKV